MGAVWFKITLNIYTGLIGEIPQPFRTPFFAPIFAPFARIAVSREKATTSLIGLKETWLCKYTVFEIIVVVDGDDGALAGELVRERTAGFVFVFDADVYFSVFMPITS